MDIGFLRALYDSPPGQPAAGGRDAAGYASVYLDTTPATESAAAEVALRWRSARERLAQAGTDDETLDAVEAAVSERGQGSGRAVFARGGTVLLSGPLPRPPRQEIAGYAPLPHVVPWLAQRPPLLPHVRVAADRAGGRVTAVPGSGPATDVRVPGQSWPVHRVSAGGWSEPRLQRSAAETWAENAKRTAEAAAVAAAEHDAAFVVVGGDVRERAMVLDLLPVALRQTAVTVDRETGPDGPEFEAAALAESELRAGQSSQAKLEELRARLSRPDAPRAVAGLADTLTALRDGLVSDVLLADDPGWAATAWVGPGLSDAAATQQQLTRRGTGEPVTDRADAAIARAAAGTGAELHLLPPSAGRPPGEVAALLRAPATALETS